MAEPLRRRRRGGLWCAGGLILMTGGARAAEPNQPVLHRRSSEGAAQVLAPGTADADASGASTEPSAAVVDFARQGFFARFALGTGVFTASSGSPADTRSFLGAPVSFEAYFGKTASSHVSLGVGYGRDAIGRLSSKDELIDEDEPQLGEVTFYLEQLAVFLELYPSPSSPYYGFATLGAGTLNVRRERDEFELPVLHWMGHLVGNDPGGIILTLGGGYEAWLNERWALGISGRLLAAFLSSSIVANEDAAVTVLMPSVLLTLTYH